MILDTSAVLAMSFAEPRAAWVLQAIRDRTAEPLFVSWVNIAEAEIHLMKRKLAAAGLMDMLRRMAIEPLAIDAEITRLVAHARLNFPLHFGDCFAYAHAKLSGEALLMAVGLSLVEITSTKTSGTSLMRMSS
jgi:ribonuclease VapC